MLRKDLIFANNQIYHIYNRGVDKRVIFSKKSHYLRFIELIEFYRSARVPIRYSYFNQLSSKQKTDLKNNNKSDPLINIHAFCLMPNHIHLVLEQLKENGISTFMRKISSGYSHYYNPQVKRTGHLFQGNFGAKRIEDDEQFMHVVRYVHLNPVTGYVIERDKLPFYQFSSYPSYLKEAYRFVHKDLLKSFFKSTKNFVQFHEEQIDYARNLDSIKHLLLE